MRKYYLIALAAAASTTLTGCATLLEVRSRICDNYEVVRDQAERQLDAANDIADPTKRAAAMSILALTIAALEKCPQARHSAR